MPSMYCIVKFAEFAGKDQRDFAGGAVTVFADDAFGHAFFVGIGVVVFITIHEHNQVGILFDGTGFTQVGHHGAFVGAGFNSTRQL